MCAKKLFLIDTSIIKMWIKWLEETGVATLQTGHHRYIRKLVNLQLVRAAIHLAVCCVTNVRSKCEEESNVVVQTLSPKFFKSAQINVHWRGDVGPTWHDHQDSVISPF